MRVSPDREHVLTGGWSHVILSTIAGEEIWRSAEEVDTGYLAFSKDGRYALAASRDSVAYTWDLRSDDRSATTYSGHQNGLNCVALSIDETLLATASKDGSIRIWDRASRTAILRLFHSGVHRVAFTARGQLVSAGMDGTVRWWWLEGEDLRVAIQQIEVAALTPEERSRLSHLLDS